MKKNLLLTDLLMLFSILFLTGTALAENGGNRVNPGDVMTFGRYEQDNDLSDGPEAIEWIVLDVQDNKALLISKYLLDWKAYNTEGTETTWETCSLRKWLNEEFLDSAFSRDEQDAVLVTDVDNSISQTSEYGSLDGGKNTQDRIYVLSHLEAGEYFASDKARKCSATAYANAQGKAQGKFVTDSWWLRSPYQTRMRVSMVYNGNRQNALVDDMKGVRPAFWVDLGSVNLDAALPVPTGKYPEVISRHPEKIGFMTAQDLSSRTDVQLKNGMVPYVPSDSQPLNAYIVSGPLCEIPFGGSGPQRISKKGFDSNMPGRMTETAKLIEEKSKGAIRFVAEPEQADILVVFDQKYENAGKYTETGGSRTVTVYSCSITVSAYQLSNLSNTAKMKTQKKPGATIPASEIASMGSAHYMRPELDCSEMDGFVKTILCWYGLMGHGFEKADEILQIRGFSDGRESAGDVIRKIQKAYGLPQTGVVDYKTLVAIYFDQEAVDAVTD